MKDSFDQGLSFLVRHHPSNEIVATITAKDLYLTVKKNPYDASGPSSGSPIVDLSDELIDKFVHQDFDRELKENMVLLIVSGATRFQHSNKGLGMRLRAFVCDYARDKKGYQYAFVRTSNPATSHIYLNKMGGKETRRVDPTTWQWKKKDGSYPAKSYEGEPIISILVELGSNEKKIDVDVSK